MGQWSRPPSGTAGRRRRSLRPECSARSRRWSTRNLAPCRSPGELHPRALLCDKEHDTMLEYRRTENWNRVKDLVTTHCHMSWLTVTYRCHMSLSLLTVTVMSHCHNSLSHIAITTHCHSHDSLSLWQLTVTVMTHCHCNDSLSHLGFPPPSHSSQLNDAIITRCHTSLSRLAVTPPCYDSLSHFGLPPPSHSSQIHDAVITRCHTSPSASLL